ERRRTPSVSCAGLAWFRLRDHNAPELTVSVNRLLTMWENEWFEKEDSNRDKQQPAAKSMPKPNRMVGTIRFVEHEFAAFKSDRLGFSTHFHRKAPNDSRHRLWWRQDTQQISG